MLDTKLPSDVEVPQLHFTLHETWLYLFFFREAAEDIENAMQDKIQ